MVTRAIKDVMDSVKPEDRWMHAYTYSGHPTCCAVALRNLDIMEKERLWENASYFKAQLQSMGVNTGKSNSYVVPIVVGEDRSLMYELGHALRRHGLFVTPVDYPAAALDQARFRASVTTAHTRQDLDRALQIIEDVFVPVMRSKGLLLTTHV